MIGRIVVLLALVISHLPLDAVSAEPALPIWRASSPWSTERAFVTIGNQTIGAEIADTSPLQIRGLSYRDELLPGAGMLFVFDSHQVRSFWMRGMRFCLDIIWIDDGRIAGAAENVCPMPEVPEADLPRYSSEVPVSFVLEVPGGWMDEHGFEAGERVDIELPESAGG